MIKHAHGIKSYYMSEEREFISNKYLEADICLGFHQETPILETIFLEYFRSVSHRIFIYSNFSKDDFIRYDYNSLSDPIANFEKGSYDLILSFSAEMMELKKSELINKLKNFIFDCQAHRSQNIAIKVFYEDGVQTTFELPKYLSFEDLQAAIDSLDREFTKIMSLESNFGKTLLFDLKSETFRLD